MVLQSRQLLLSSRRFADVLFLNLERRLSSILPRRFPAISFEITLLRSLGSRPLYCLYHGILFTAWECCNKQWHPSSPEVELKLEKYQRKKKNRTPPMILT